MTLKTTPYDTAEFLDSDEAIKAYVEAAFEDGDPALIARCLGAVARARKMTGLDAITGLSEQELQHALSGVGNPDFATILKVMKALGISIIPTVARDRHQLGYPPAA